MTPYPWHNDSWRQLFGDPERLPHALLIQGAEGIGKYQFATAIAAAMLCEAPSESQSACGRCEACVWFQQGSHPDLRNIMPDALAIQPEGQGDGGGTASPAKKASNFITIDQIRDLEHFVRLTSHRNGRRVVIVYPAEAMNANAANALLKTLEEPGPMTHFLLVSHRPSSLPATVRSRCRPLLLRPPSVAEANAWLKAQGVTDAEGCLAQAGGAPLRAARLADPGHRAARQAFFSRLSQLPTDPAGAASDLHKNDLPPMLDWLFQWTYDLVCVKLAARPFYNPDFSAPLQEHAKRANLMQLQAFQKEVMEARRAMHHPLNPQLVLENLLVAYAAALSPSREKTTS